MTKTTMAEESHWSVLKRHYLRNYNRPRSELLVYLIDKKIIPKHEGKLEILLFGRSKLVWWYRFVSCWKREANREMPHDHIADHERWICQCPAYKYIEFMFCKHLVKGKTLPNYRELGRLGQPLF